MPEDLPFESPYGPQRYATAFDAGYAKSAVWVDGARIAIEDVPGRIRQLNRTIRELRASLDQQVTRTVEAEARTWPSECG